MEEGGGEEDKSMEEKGGEGDSNFGTGPGELVTASNVTHTKSQIAARETQTEQEEEVEEEVEEEEEEGKREGGSAALIKQRRFDERIDGKGPSDTRRKLTRAKTREWQYNGCR